MQNIFYLDNSPVSHQDSQVQLQFNTFGCTISVFFDCNHAYSCYNILKYINDYKLNLIVPKEIKDFSLFSSELKNVLEFIASSNDKNAIRKITKENSYQKLHVNTVQLINACANIKIPIPEGEQEVNMCNGLHEWLKEETEKAVSKAVIQASIEAWQDVSLPKEEIISKLKTKYNLTESEAENYYKEFSLQTV